MFGFSHFDDHPKVSTLFLQTKLRRLRSGVPVAEDGAELTTAQIYDLEHHRRLKALHRLVEGGATLSEAARLVGISQITAYRWNDNGRR
jgi:hypothetical protein